MQVRFSRLWFAVNVAVALCLLAVAAGASALEVRVSRVADEAAKQIAGVFPLMQGLVVEVDGNRVLVDLGARRGAYEGMELEIHREGEEIKHPLTGQLLGRRDVRLGVIRVTVANEEFSETVVVSREKGVEFSWGDSVRVSSDRIIVALPLIDLGEVRDANVHSITKDLVIALAKTGRFMVVEEPLMQASLPSQRLPASGHFADPVNLEVLAEKLRAQALVLGKLSRVGQKVFLGLQVLSTRTGGALGLASVELKEF